MNDHVIVFGFERKLEASRNSAEIYYYWKVLKSSTREY